MRVQLAGPRHHAGPMSFVAAAVLALALGAGCMKPATDVRDELPGGARLWSDNCGRCHNMRPPSQYSSKEWGIIMLHMRVRAGMTGAETRAIRAFLESGQ